MLFVYFPTLLFSTLAFITSGFQSPPTQICHHHNRLYHEKSILEGRKVFILSNNNNNDDDEAETITTEEEPKKSVEPTEPSMKAQATFSIFKVFSYCIQFLGAFFFMGLLLNFAGFGYTVDLEHGLVIDRIENIRNEIQFEREIERETMEGSKYLIAPKVPE